MKSIEGDTVREVLQYVQFAADELMRAMRKSVEKALREQKLTPRRIARAAEVLREWAGGVHVSWSEAVRVLNPLLTFRRTRASFQSTLKSTGAVTFMSEIVTAIPSIQKSQLTIAKIAFPPKHLDAFATGHGISLEAPSDRDYREHTGKQ